MGEVPKKKHATMIVPCTNCSKLINVKPEHRGYKTHNCSPECSAATKSKQGKERWRKINEAKNKKDE